MPPGPPGFLWSLSARGYFLGSTLRARPSLAPCPEQASQPHSLPMLTSLDHLRWGCVLEDDPIHVRPLALSFTGGRMIRCPRAFSTPPSKTAHGFCHSFPVADPALPSEPLLGQHAPPSCPLMWLYTAVQDMTTNISPCQGPFSLSFITPCSLSTCKSFMYFKVSSYSSGIKFQL